MALGLEAARRLFEHGEFRQMIESTDLSERGIPTLNVEYCALLAHALVQTGDLSTATRLALLAAQRSSQPSLRSKAHVVLGIVAECSGDMAAALEHFQIAVRLASNGNDYVQSAWAHLRLLRHLVDRSSMSAVTAMLPEVRRSVIRAGSVHAIAYLHQSVSVHEGQVGRINEALRHCDVLDSLISTAPNLWLTTGNLVIAE